ncbi:DNA replication licensing factor MCM5 [Hondaea fermentalgiana]|uniref:DNA replication licensing factor MCM5 n=1 Tax=Hondaea fermentalgiana TaxID=2315210 RepID=A0A2R5GHY7_9STRA|nr:DNA replication licensing factor MCM5 [Hondaea fermentalgiana]|eukprot:GBG29338.1 DNA replication licensing factor MCM5 [Hondaea fermentalgiana]
MATAWDERPASYTNQNLGAGEADVSRNEKKRVLSRFREFIRNYREASTQVFPYRAQLLERFRRGEHKLVVELEHLNNYDEELLDMLLQRPAVYLDVFEEAAKQALQLTTPSRDEMQSGEIPDIQVLLSSKQKPTPLRTVSANDMNKLLMIPGIVTHASRASAKAVELTFICTSCRYKKTIPCANFNKAVKMPRSCPAPECPSPNDSFKVLPDQNKYVDAQWLKLQEAPEAVPTGEMPRSINLSVTRNLVDQVSPGMRIKVMGISSVRQQSGKTASAKGGSRMPSSVKDGFLTVVGIEVMDDESGRSSSLFTPEEEQTFHNMARSRDIYGRIARSIAPAISGDYTHDIKKAIACLLFGGSRRILPDGMKLRGDINVLMLGDPSTAKSQFLKFVEKVAPVGVYTSGKGSSAAGLTANVIKDSRGEFFLEGGAMVLADGGVVCIDEFDKMREQDRVAIHEAMEQQTISVAKAGITTVLNSRSSVLAAANPVFGTYDEMKSAAENIDFLPTILSRFDLIFIVRDIRDEAKDRLIARHVIGVHVDASTAVSNFDRGHGGGGTDAVGTDEERTQGEIDLLLMKKYIKYCRLKCAPVLSPAAAELLRNNYVGIREDHRKRQRESSGGGSPTVPITIRQLEAVVRIAESLAKMELAFEATPAHVTEAIRLFKVSTLNAASNGAAPGDMSSLGREQVREVQAVEDQIKRRVPIGSTVSQRGLIDEFVSLQGYSQFAVRKALQIMLERGEVKHASQQKKIRRVR